MAEVNTDRFILDIANKQSFDDPNLALAVSKVENRPRKPELVSPAGAVGLMQIMPAQFRSLRDIGRLPAGATIDNPEHNVVAGLETLKDALSRSGGDIKKALAMYNAGPKGRFFGTPSEGVLAAETRQYPGKVLNEYNQLIGADQATLTREMRGVTEPKTDVAVSAGAQSLSPIEQFFSIIRGFANGTSQ